MYTLCRKRMDEMWLFKCHLGKKFIGSGYLEGKIIVLYDRHKYKFIHAECVCLEIKNNCNHDSCGNTNTTGTGTLMTIIKYIPHNPNIYQKMRLIMLNEPFVVIYQSHFHHKSLFINLEMEELNTVYNWYCITVMLKCQNCGKVLTMCT